jgi:uncharacterized membrane protein YfcA
MLPALILVSVFVTAVLSGVLGMAGGMILMAILVSTLSVSAAMMLHGAVQAASNGSRYYGVLIGAAGELPWWLYAAAMATAVAGARVGTRLLERLADEAFRRVSGWVILAIGALCILQGARTLL